MASNLMHIATAFLDAWNSHDIEQVVALYAPDYEGTDVAEAAPQQGPDAIRQSVIRYYRAFPDLTLVKEWVVADGNQVALAWTAHGTHQGKVMNIPPSGRQVSVRGVSFLSLDGDKVVRGLHIWDMAGMLRQIGLLPELPT